MSDNWIILIPEKPEQVPSEDKQRQAQAKLRELTPKADDVIIEVSDSLRFQDCGQNFGTIKCPDCGTELELDWWQERMGEDFGADDSFQLNPIKLPCCGVVRTLHELWYEWPMGFTKFSLITKNPNIGELPKDSVAAIEAILGCPLRVIYSHI